MELCQKCKTYIEKNGDKEKIIHMLVDEAMQRVREYISSHGNVNITDVDVIDIIPMGLADDWVQNHRVTGHDTLTKTDLPPQGWFALLRYHLNKCVRDLLSAVKLEKVGDLLTMDVRRLFKLDERDAIIVDSVGNIARSIGKVLDDIVKIPVVGPILGNIAEFIAALSCKIFNNRKLIIETEFAVENLQNLMTFGVRHEQLMAIAIQMFHRLNDFDQAFEAKIAENEALKARVLASIEAARERVNQTIHKTSQRLTDGADQFDADIHELISKL